MLGEGQGSHHLVFLQAMKPPGSQGSQSTYTDLLSVIEEMGKEIRPTYAGSKSAMERLKRGMWHPTWASGPGWTVPGFLPLNLLLSFPRHHPCPGTGQRMPGRDRAQRPHVTECHPLCPMDLPTSLHRLLEQSPSPCALLVFPTFSHPVTNSHMGWDG